jgi:hypothetical protein
MGEAAAAELATVVLVVALLCGRLRPNASSMVGCSDTLVARRRAGWAVVDFFALKDTMPLTRGRRMPILPLYAV